MCSPQLLVVWKASYSSQCSYAVVCRQQKTDIDTRTQTHKAWCNYLPHGINEDYSWNEPFVLCAARQSKNAHTVQAKGDT